MTVFFGFSLIPSRKSRLLTCLIGNTDLAANNAGESVLIVPRGGSLMSFLKLRQAPGVYSRVTEGMAI